MNVEVWTRAGVVYARNGLYPNQSIEPILGLWKKRLAKGKGDTLARQVLISPAGGAVEAGAQKGESY